jgi:thioredoxin-related protein
MKMMKILFLLLSLQFLSFASEINIDKLIEKASKEHKHVFVYLHWKDCVYCQEMDMFTLHEPAIEKKVKNDFLYVDIETSRNETVIYKDFKGSAKEFVKRIGFGFPVCIFYDNDKSIAGLFPGVYDEDEFTVVLDFIKTNKYKKMDLDEYEKKIGFKKKKK